jgi:hypothetical protein
MPQHNSSLRFQESVCAKLKAERYVHHVEACAFGIDSPSAGREDCIQQYFFPFPFICRSTVPESVQEMLVRIDAPQLFMPAHATSRRLPLE